MKLYYAPGSCALAAHIALEEAAADYTAERIDLKAGQQTSAGSLAVTPNGRVPALVTDRGILTETPAILAFIAQSAPDAQLMPLDDPFAFAQAQATLAAEYRATGGDWQAREDDAMTRLYNYFSQDFARDAFCARAGQVLGQADGIAPASFETFAGEQLPALDRPFVDFFRAYDAWRTGEAARPVIAYAAPAPMPVAARPAKAAKAPRLRVDMSALQDQSLAGG